MKAKEFDAKFDQGEDITEFLDLSQAKRPGHQQKRVDVDFPTFILFIYTRIIKLSAIHQR